MSDFRDAAKAMFRHIYLPKSDERLKEKFGSDRRADGMRDEIEHAYITGYQDGAKGVTQELKNEVLSLFGDDA